MSKNLFALLAALIVASVANAETIVYICERPAWEGVEGCGPSNTAFIYAFWVETDDFDHNRDMNKLWHNYPRHKYAVREGCDMQEARGKKGHFTVTDEAITFWLGKAVLNSQKVELDTITMTAELTGHTVKDGHDLMCEEIKGDEIELHPSLPSLNPILVWPSSPNRPGS